MGLSCQPPVLSKHSADNGDTTVTLCPTSVIIKCKSIRRNFRTHQAQRASDDCRCRVTMPSNLAHRHVTWGALCNGPLNPFGAGKSQGHQWLSLHGERSVRDKLNRYASHHHSKPSHTNADVW
eukprot:4358318-Amphidinium_carterae.1